jgi:hypothetical protein
MWLNSTIANITASSRGAHEGARSHKLGHLFARGRPRVRFRLPLGSHKKKGAVAPPDSDTDYPSVFLRSRDIGFGYQPEGAENTASCAPTCRNWLYIGVLNACVLAGGVGRMEPVGHGVGGTSQVVVAVVLGTLSDGVCQLIELR